jgi:hypothetical protein
MSKFMQEIIRRKIAEETINEIEPVFRKAVNQQWRKRKQQPRKSQSNQAGPRSQPNRTNK